MKMIYMSHPFTGNEEKNREAARESQIGLVKSNPGACIINPIDLFAGMFAGGPNGYTKILACCLEVLGRCDMIVMCKGWEKSTGCRAERAFAIQKGIEMVDA